MFMCVRAWGVSVCERENVSKEDSKRERKCRSK